MYEFMLRFFNYNQGLRGKFWISEKHLEARRSSKFVERRMPVNYAKLDNGKVMMYSEWNTSFAANSSLKYNDVIYLGRGRYHHNNLYRD